MPYSRLLRLAKEPSKASLYELWRAIGDDARSEAIELLLEAEHEYFDDHLLEKLAEQLNFRKKTLARWPSAKVGELGARFETRESRVLSALLTELHIGARTDVLEGFLDRLGLPHDRGVLDSDAAGEIELGLDDVSAAADRLREDWGDEIVVTYFLTLLLHDPETWQGLESWLRDRFAGVQEEAAEESRDEAAHDVQEPPDIRDETPPGFTTLDEHLIRSIVDVAQDVEGALSDDRLQELVEELIELNSSRHRSFFHLGFADVILDREPRKTLPAENESRSRWYWAGHVSGLARRARWEEIVRHVENDETVVRLGTRGDGPSHLGAPLLFRAFAELDRPNEGAELLSVESVTSNQGLFDQLYLRGRDLIREDRAPEARGIFRLLGSAMERLESEGVDVSTRRFLEVRRRQAHCLRQLGEAAAAQEILHELLEEESDPQILSMVHTDLGLLEAGFRSLAEVELPLESGKLDALIASLNNTVSRFQRATEYDVDYSGHGHFCMGVLHLAQREYGAAVHALERGLALFESQPSRYQYGGLLRRARLYLGIAMVLDMQHERFVRATELMKQSVSKGARVPPYFVGDLLEALSLSDQSHAEEMAEVLLEASGDAVLDSIVDSSAAIFSPAVASALLLRAEEEDRPWVDRAADFRRSVTTLLQQGKVEGATLALDRLETAAIKGHGVHEFLELLSEPSNYDPAWSESDALGTRILLLERLGEYRRAAMLLEEEFHRVTSDQRYDWKSNAKGILERIQSYGLDSHDTSRLEARFDAQLEVLQEEERAPTKEEATPVRVLFVGGNETQEQYDARLQEWFEENHPSIDVSFLHPGWSSNWGSDLERIERKLPVLDAVAIMKFIRTEFGRQLRKTLGDTPWVGCYGSGFDSIRRSILEAAEWGRRSA